MCRSLRPTLAGALLGCTILAAAALAQPAPPALPADPAPLTLAQALDLALAANPGIAAARLRPEVARAGIDVARQRLNPQLTLEETKETPRDAATLAQEIEVAGKRRRRIELAQAQVASGEAEVARAIALTRSRVRRAFYALAAAERRRAEAEAVLHLAERTRDAARDRFNAGDVARLDVVQAELAAAQADNDRESALGALASARADLNTLLARPPAAPLAVRGDLWEGGLADGVTPEGLAGLARTAVGASTEIALLDRGIAEQRAKVALARADNVPNPTVSGSVTHRSPPDFDWGWRASLTVAIPIFTHRGAAVTVEERTLAQLEAERRARAEEIAGAVYGAASAAAAQRQTVLRYRDQILPQAEEVERMAEDSYRSGQTGLPALLQAFQSTRDLRLKAIQAGADYQNALADLESAMGAPLP
ncbi:MAG TPA: TolC family protein [Thermoanaerobaculia bacterium]|nr:TolC family protein [Thermoanaerobaculia bacterium]